MMTPPRKTPAVPPAGAAGAVERKGLRQLARVVHEHRDEQGQRGRSDQRGADALHGAACELEPCVASQGGKDGSGEQDDPPGAEHAARAEQVREPAAEQEQTTEGDDVGIEDPGQVRL